MISCKISTEIVNVFLHGCQVCLVPEKNLSFGLFFPIRNNFGAYFNNFMITNIEAIGIICNQIGLVGQKRSKMLFFLVGFKMICSRPALKKVSRKVWFNCLLYWLLLMVRSVQLISGKLKSPAIQIRAFLFFIVMLVISLQIDFA